VVDEPGQIPRLRAGERRDDADVQGTPVQRGQALLDGPAGQFVAEREPVGADLQHTLLLGLGQDVEPLAEQLTGQPELDGRGHDGQLLDGGAARRIEPADPGQHRVRHGGRHGDPRRGQGLGDVERVPAGQGVQRCGVVAAARGETGDGGRRQGGQGEPVHGRRGERAEDPAQGMRGRHLLVAEGQHQHRGQVGEAAGDVPEHVERGVVGPVQVFDDQHGGAPRGELGDGRTGDRVRLVAGDRRGECAGGTGGGFAQRPERSRAQQVVAGAGEDAHAVAQRRSQGSNDAGLADAGLAGDERRAAPAGARGRLEQDVQHRAPLQQRGPPTARVPARSR